MTGDKGVRGCIEIFEREHLLSPHNETAEFEYYIACHIVPYNVNIDTVNVSQCVNIM